MQMRYIMAAAMLLLAGCAQEAAAPQEDVTDFEEFDLEAREGFGIIRGVVVDAAVVPVAGATVALGSDDGPSVVTNEDGAFGFKDVEPGTHRLLVDKLGYSAVQQQTEVVAGEENPAVVKVLLEKNPSELPNVVPLNFQGFIMCSISSPAYRVAVCGAINLVQSGTVPDEFLVDHEGLAADPWHIQAEMIWESTQPAGDMMTFTTEHSSSDGGEIAPGAAGPSPLLAAANRSMIENGPYSGHIMHRVFNFEHPATTPPVPVCGIPNPVHGGDMCLKGVGATIEQKFEIFTHLFYRFAPEEGWRFSVDGPPELPPV